MSGGVRWGAALAVALAAARPRPGQEAPAQAAPAVRLHLHVDAREGDDASGDGTPGRPFHTIGRALSLQAETPDRATDVHLAFGRYGRGAPAASPEREVVP